MLGPNFILIKAAVTFSSLLPLNIQKSPNLKEVPPRFESALSKASDNIDDRVGIVILRPNNLCPEGRAWTIGGRGSRKLTKVFL